MSDAGWTTISGTPGSGSDVVLETPAQNAACKIRFRFVEPGSGNCAQVTMRHPTGATADSQINYCLPAVGSNPTGVWRIVANPYSFWAFAIGTNNKTTARSYVFGGTLYTPSFLTLTAGDGIGWVYSVGASDGDTNAHSGWRTQLGVNVNTTGEPHTAGIWTNVLTNIPTNAGQNQFGQVQLAAWQGGYSTDGYRWEDTSLLLFEPLVGWSDTPTFGVTTTARGQLYDAVIVNGTFNGEALVQFDGHTWLAITDLAAAGNVAIGTLFVVVS